MNGDFGGDVTSSSLNVASKSAEVVGKTIKDVLMGLLSFVVRRFERHTDIKLQREKLGLNKQSQVVGYVKMKKLLNSKDELVPISFKNNLSKEQLKQFDKYANRFGLSYSKIVSQTDKDKVIFVVKKKDLEMVKEISKMMYEDLLIQKVDEITQDENLQQELKDDIMRKSHNDRNKTSDDKIFRGEIEEGKNYEESLNHITDRDYSRDTPIFVCDRNNAENYMELYSKLDTYNGKQYTKTDYHIYKNNEKVYSCDDGRFDGREKNHWFNLKSNMRKEGSISEHVATFYTKEEFDNYRNIHKEEIVKQNTDIIKTNYGYDFQTNIEHIKSMLNENGISYIGYDKETGNVNLIDSNSNIMTFDDNMTFNEKYTFALSKIQVQRLENLKELNSLQNEIALKKQELSLFEKKIANATDKDSLETVNTINEYEKMQEEIKVLENDFSHGMAKNKKLVNESNLIISAYASQKAKADYDLSHDFSREKELEEEKDIDKEKEIEVSEKDGRKGMKKRKEEISKKDFNNNNNVGKSQEKVKTNAKKER